MIYSYIRKNISFVVVEITRGSSDTIEEIE